MRESPEIRTEDNGEVIDSWDMEAGFAGTLQELPPRRSSQRAIRESYCRSGMQSNLLNSPVADLSHIQLVLVTAIDGIDRAEFLRRLSCPAELAYNLARQFQLVNFAVGVDIIRWV